MRKKVQKSTISEFITLATLITKSGLKRLIQVIFIVKVNLKMMALKITECFSHSYRYIFKNKVITLTFHCGNLKGCLMKALNPSKI